MPSARDISVSTVSSRRSRSFRGWLRCGFFIVSYFVVGILFYSHVETKPHLGRKQ